MIIRCRRIYSENGEVDGYLVIDDGRITSIEPSTSNLTADMDYSNERIIPGIFDTHNHGTMGYTLSNLVPNVDEHIKGYLKGVASQGVTSVFPVIPR